MGKSPGRWIKTLLFGKKTRSQSTKGWDASKAANEKGFDGGKGETILAVHSPVISEPISISGVISTSDKGEPSNIGGNAPVISHVSQGVMGLSTLSDANANNGIEEQAAIKAQAAFRGYLARRAFRALKGIIRLQALIRGHLVRRQAVATLHAMEGIVKLQAVARGRRVRRSINNLKVTSKFSQLKTAGPITQDDWNMKYSSNAFIAQLLASSLLAKPLQIQYDKGDPNSVFSWLGRWSSTSFWQPNSKSKKAIVPKGQTKRGNCIMDTESGKTRHSIRTSPASNVGAGQTNPSYEPEKTKRNLKKVPTSAESVQEHPQSELERVKRNLRKISTAVNDTSELPDVETQKSNLSSKKVDAGLSENLGHGSEESIEKPKKDNSPTPTLETFVETALETVIAGPVDLLLDDKSTNELQLLQQIDNVENHVAMGGELSLKEEQFCHENQKISKRRSSFSTKSEYAENGMSNTPVLPSYMAATESAKAKLRGQISPRFVSESIDKNGFTRRHSLPSADGKMSSPRTKRLIQTGGKGGIGRDVNERAIQVGWRR
ncbi:unnamed protein product [Musa acuminata subsp. malaccensis]|uniref:(wild Malaysian banana) hypothetical protein n=1 Tax=Musa acuminata subsp. malaccensis TaxID=214687 RepID=A0A804ICQ8_MUSAM|nr:PREDICTED: protein IQ-DOMAIN 31 [Musa acuminata subsp. malaccensis]XP_018676748.1 PREDICTED: protein IQ-DOMAIN 31 [Musa acuminata subsp. malaccensis]CAG1850313.1 unnamed protein product [Musa acuminata subsp. malaccensis]